MVRNMVPGTHQRTYAVLEDRHLLSIPSLHIHVEIRARQEDLPKRGEGNLDEPVLALAKRCPDSSRHANHPEWDAADVDLLADRVKAREKLRHEILADETYHGLVRAIRVVEIATGFHLGLPDVNHVRSLTGDFHFMQDVCFVPHVPAAEVGLRANILIALDGVAKIFEVLNADGLVAMSRFQPVVAAHCKTELREDENICPQVGNVIGDIEVHAIDDGHDYDERGGGNHHAQQGKEGTQFVGAQCLQGYPEGLAGGDPKATPAAPAGSLLAEKRLRLADYSHETCSCVLAATRR